MSQIPAGRYTGRAVGEIAFGEDSKGGERIGLRFEILNQGYEGRTVETGIDIARDTIDVELDGIASELPCPGDHVARVSFHGGAAKIAIAGVRIQALISATQHLQILLPAPVAQFR